MIPSAQTKQNKIINELVELSFEQRYSPFVLNKYKREAKQLLNIDPGSAHMIMGIVASLECNLNELHHQFKASLRSIEDRVTCLKNYVYVLERLARYEEALAIAKQAYEQYPHHPLAINTYSKTSTYYGAFRRALQTLFELETHICEKPPFLNLLSSIVEFLDSKNITDDNLQQFVKTTTDSLISRNVYVHNVTFEYHSGDDWLRYEYFIDVDDDELADIEEEIDKKMGDIPEHVRDAIIFEFIGNEKDLKELLDYVDQRISENPHEIVEADEVQLKRIAKLIGEDF